MIRHAILTRSAYVPGGDAQMWTNAKVDQSYVTHRVRMLRDHLAASLAAQTRKDFVWIVKLHDECPLINEQIELLNSMPFETVPFVVSGRKGQSPNKSWHEVVTAACGDAVTHILTTRVDDDDMLAPDFVERLRVKVRESESCNAYSFPVGFCVRLHSKGSHFTTWSKLENQFCSLLSPVEPLQIVMDRKHGNLGELGSWIIVDKKPGHAWVRHPRSKSHGGRFRARKPVADLVKVWPFLRGRIQ